MLEPTPEDYQHIRDKILDYLSRQGFSEKKLLQKVTDLKKHYPNSRRYLFYTPEHVQKVLDELKVVGLVDDEKYCRDVLRQLQDRKDGVYRIKEKMRRRLLPPAVIETVLGEWKRSGVAQDYTAIVRETSRKYERLKEKYPSKKEQYTIRGKLYAFLGQKGYELDQIKEILGKAMDAQ